ncbi:hypothetical protein ITP53_13760 [Nonomuraea sp. K274]|uniref:Uncharacterized protein n=1 Tax=Nonomuraea cypriaca TaxID=1187855 RepID=A0A931F0V9_9ACTN|nr:hypothetical protein [Nonomuraea cypriaca]MBF8186788.1 hypothetical protein [Nonomuraea cypriaca]
MPPSPDDLASSPMPADGQSPSPGNPQDAPRPSGGGSRRAAPGSRRRRTLLVAAGAVLACLVTTAANAYDNHLFYKTVTEDETRLTTVAAGQTGKVHNIEWKAAVAPTKAPPDSKHGAEVTWLRVDISKKALDASSATMTAEPAEVKLEDRAGRTWTVETQWVGDTPIDRLVVGREYKIQGLAIVPTPVANEVELSFRPSNYKSDTPTEDLFTREGAAKLLPDVDVLRFKRR